MHTRNSMPHTRRHLPQNPLAVCSFAEAGDRAVALADINEENAQKAAETARKYATHPNFRTLIIGVDVADAESVQKMIDVTAKELGRIDYAVNGAGVQSSSSLFFFGTFSISCSVETKKLIYIYIYIDACQYQRPHALRAGRNQRHARGVILNVGSADSYAGLPAKTAYTVSKHAVMGLTKIAALDHAADGIRVNAACPTWVRTPMVEEECRRNPTVMQMGES
ncbi:uncharacterized protein EAE98_009828 [Botrytis deweyae]|uniref:Uncharacterized protein n=1 Tax=Botrytis deweyae TaxID=2478750 RepID=A0ABQ7IAB4_9HELO|nr:uncharacterized protein EAE98_009828 [Botrytis deweyae]KAF7918216.1 hypothetical protein EAE98_009828 [Botrytis deweyae]